MQWVYDLNDGRWMPTVYPNVPTRIKQDVDGTLDFLTNSLLFKVSPSADRFNSANFSMDWESNNVQILKEGREGFGYDVLIKGIVVEYESDVPVTIFLYLDDATTASPPDGTFLSETNRRVAFQVPLSCVCKYFRLKFSATTTTSNQTAMIKSVEVYYEEMPHGGDILKA
jgi:hypothetical protein